MNASWELAFLPEAEEDLAGLNPAAQARVVKALAKVASNPLPQSEGGYGKPLGNKGGTNLSGLLKVKLKADGVRIVYKLERVDGVVKVVVIGMRADDEVYRIAARRRAGSGL